MYLVTVSVGDVRCARLFQDQRIGKAGISRLMPALPYAANGSLPSGARLLSKAPQGPLTVKLYYAKFLGTESTQEHPVRIL